MTRHPLMRFEQSPRLRTRGFTLVEVLVALAIVAVAIAAGMQASSALIGGADRQRDSVLAQICLENYFAETRMRSLTGEQPAPGEQTVECTQASLNYQVHATVRQTANINIFSVEATAKNPDGANVLTLMTIVGNQ